jgi:hypothetical protein
MASISINGGRKLRIAVLGSTCFNRAGAYFDAGGSRTGRRVGALTPA